MPIVSAVLVISNKYNMRLTTYLNHAALMESAHIFKDPKGSISSIIYDYIYNDLAYRWDSVIVSGPAIKYGPVLPFSMAYNLNYNLTSIKSKKCILIQRGVRKWQYSVYADMEGVDPYVRSATCREWGNGNLKGL